jgi:hypothetical protein
VDTDKEAQFGSGALHSSGCAQRSPTQAGFIRVHSWLKKQRGHVTQNPVKGRQ